MTITKPDSMDGCLYFTSRAIGEGYLTAWAYRPECPSCKKGRMGKPLTKTGKPDKKADFYECPECEHKIPIDEMDELLKLQVEYDCPHCHNEGMAETDYKRQSFKGVQAYVFLCEKCGEKIPVTKKLKEIKKKKPKK